MATKTEFIIPIIEEISSFMKEKKPGWPKAFCDFYASKFFNSYEASGWKLSAGKGGPVKNWRACFLNNWQMLKYQEDREMLLALTPKPKPIDHDTLEYLNEALDGYRKDAGSMTEIRLAACYDWMKENKLLQLNKKQREQAIEDSRIDLMKGKATAVRFVFDHLVKNLLTFNYFFNEVAQ